MSRDALIGILIGAANVGLNIIGLSIAIHSTISQQMLTDMLAAYTNATTCS